MARPKTVNESENDTEKEIAEASSHQTIFLLLIANSKQ